MCVCVCVRALNLYPNAGVIGHRTPRPSQTAGLSTAGAGQASEWDMCRVAQYLRERQSALRTAHLTQTAHQGPIKPLGGTPRFR